MSFGQRVLDREHGGNPVETMWIVFDQQYRNSYVFAAELFPRMPIPPQSWYDAGIAHRSDDLGGDLAEAIGCRETDSCTTCPVSTVVPASATIPTFTGGAAPMTATTAIPPSLRTRTCVR